jgi:general secretion pathway protein B
MSFILDALRKSENARQRQGGPALAEVPIGRRRENRPWWVWAVAALLAINLIVLLVVLIRSPEPSETSPANTAAPTVAPTAAVPAPAAAVPAPAVVVTSPPASPLPVAAPSVNPAAPLTSPVTQGRTLADEAATAAAELRDPSAPAAAANVPDRGSIVRQVNPGAPAVAGQAGPEENLPLLNELTGDRAVGMPPMHLDIHVYSTNPVERFVFINMRKYTEGATLTEGPVVERIRTDGVVLNQRGFRFVLPRQ